MHGILRPAITGCKTPRFGSDQLSSFCGIGKLCGFHSCFGQGIREPKLREHSHGVRENINADTQRADVFSRLNR